MREVRKFHFGRHRVRADRADVVKIRHRLVVRHQPQRFGHVPAKTHFRNVVKCVAGVLNYVVEQSNDRACLVVHLFRDMQRVADVRQTAFVDLARVRFEAKPDCFSGVVGVNHISPVDCKIRSSFSISVMSDGSHFTENSSPLESHLAASCSLSTSFPATTEAQ